MLKRLLIGIALVSTSAAAFGEEYKPTKKERAAMAMSPEQAATRLKVSGLDALDPTLWVSTQPFLPYQVRSDKFLRAAIDKATGAVTYQLYLSLLGGASMGLSHITYAVDGKLERADARRINFDVSCHRYGCTHLEEYVVDMDRATLERLAHGASTDGAYWTMRMFFRSVEGENTNLLKNETAALLLAVDRQIAALGLQDRAAEKSPSL